MKLGKFIVIEGIDGSGKTTQSKMLVDFINKRDGKEMAVLTREQTNGLVGKLIESVLMRGEKLDPVALQVCFIADRVDHVNTFISPEKDKGRFIVSDRYYWSTAAYGYLSGVGKMELFLDINQKLCPEPDIFILVDLDPKVALERMNLSRESLSIFEKQEKLEKIREAYKLLAKKNKDNVIIIDGNRSAGEIHKEIIEKLKEKDIL
jgi:dTMP kinase